jgi:hypothetical protein
MKSTTCTKFYKAYFDYVESKDIINRICVDMLKEICYRTEDRAINLTKMTNFLFDSGDRNIAFAYDSGGEHPEIYSTYSAVEGFALDNNTIVFTLEDSDRYEESQVTTEDLICLCDAIVDYENAGYELGVNEYESEE